MGFGLITIGLALLMGVEVGFGLVGYPLMFAGFRRLTRIDDDFLICGVLALLNIPYSAVCLLELLGVVGTDSVIAGCLTVANYVFSAVMYGLFFQKIRRIAIDGGSAPLERESTGCLLMFGLYYVFSLAAVFIPVIRSTLLVGVLTVFRYLLIAFGILLLLNCGAKITTAEVIEREMRK